MTFPALVIACLLQQAPAAPAQRAEQDILADWGAATPAQRQQLLFELTAVATEHSVATVLEVLRGKAGAPWAAGLTLFPRLAREIPVGSRRQLLVAALDAIESEPEAELGPGLGPVNLFMAANPDFDDLLFQRLPSDRCAMNDLAALRLQATLRRNPALAFARLAAISDDELVPLLEALGRNRGDSPSFGWRTVVPPSEPLLELCDRLLESDRGPEVRATVLLAMQPADPRRTSAGDIRARYAAESHALVRIALIRLAGVIGPNAENLDLGAMLLTEDDPELLPDIIQARTLWTDFIQYDCSGFEYLPGRWCTWLRMGHQGGGPWTPEERARLEELLTTRSEPGLRDACSVALAREQHPARRGWSPPTKPVEGLEVHEWGVFLDGENRIFPPERVIAELPGFVHRSRSQLADIARARTYTPMAVTKPVLFFHGGAPRCLTVNVHFADGRPWTFYPDATDYPVRMERVAGRTWGQSTIPPVRERRSEESVTPPWLIEDVGKAPSRWSGSMDRTALPDLAADDLLRRYSKVPWLAAEGFPTQTGGGSQSVRDVGLAWYGLRIAHSSDLEAPLPPVPDDHWWQHLRDVGADLVAHRGESERFLFYDGAACFPSPVGVKRIAERTLLFWAHDFNDYPTADAFGRRRQAVPVGPGPIPAVFVIEVTPDRKCSGNLLTELSDLDAPRELDLSKPEFEGAALIERFHAVLETAGLNAKEASSLVETWRTEFFETPGLRVISLLPRWAYDRVVPLEIVPTPTKLERVALVWRECGELPISRGVDDTARELPAAVPAEFTQRESSIVWEPWTPPADNEWHLGADGTLMELQPRGGVRATISDDGRRVAAAITPRSKEAELVLWDIERSRTARLTGLTGLGALTASPDGRYVGYVAESGETARILDLAENRSLAIETRTLSIGAGVAVFVRKNYYPEDPNAPPPPDGMTRMPAIESIELISRDLESNRETVLYTGGRSASFGDLAIDRAGKRVLFQLDQTLQLADLEHRSLRVIAEGGANELRFPVISGNRVCFNRRSRTLSLMVDLTEGILSPLAPPERVAERSLFSAGEAYVAYDTRHGPDGEKRTGVELLELESGRRWYRPNAWLHGITRDGRLLIRDGASEPTRLRLVDPRDKQ